LAVELTAENPKVLYIPEGIPHGFQTLIDSRAGEKQFFGLGELSKT
jgi:dTDP-4-dehydrorhamnose 3,5-epimerase-like enzyme